MGAPVILLLTRHWGDRGDGLSREVGSLWEAMAHPSGSLSFTSRGSSLQSAPCGAPGEPAESLAPPGALGVPGWESQRVRPGGVALAPGVLPRKAKPPRSPCSASLPAAHTGRLRLANGLAFRAQRLLSRSCRLQRLCLTAPPQRTGAEDGPAGSRAELLGAAGSHHRLWPVSHAPPPSPLWVWRSRSSLLAWLSPCFLSSRSACLCILPHLASLKQPGSHGNSHVIGRVGAWECPQGQEKVTQQKD